MTSLALAIGVLAIAGCQTPPLQTTEPVAANVEHSPSLALQAWHDAVVAEILPFDLSLREILGKPMPILPPDSLDDWRGVADRAAALRADGMALDLSSLTEDQRLTHAYIDRLLLSVEDFPEQWLYSFPVTPYAGGWKHNRVRQLAQATSLKASAQRDDYLRALKAYAAYIASQQQKLALQATRGIRIAKRAIPGARAVANNLATAATGLIPDRTRLGGVERAVADDFLARTQAIVSGQIQPAFREMAAALDENYVAAAPARVGLMHQPNGLAHYRNLVQRHTDTRLSPEAIHAIGLEILQQARAELDRIKAEVGFQGNHRAFAAMVDADPRFAAKTPQEVEAHFARAMKRIEPAIPRYFSLIPKAPYTVERAPPQVEQGMTFGFYRPPTPDVPVGAYLYNGADPAGRSYANAAALIYHELLPGHHFQIALQQENQDLPVLRRANSFLPLTAYIEGWAEYAADLAGEMGMYATPFDRYGRLYSKMFLANRLVVDTGLNAMGWTLDQARDFMRENTFASDAEIDSELLRYSTDIPGQALAYAMGERELMRMRADARAAMGDNFSLTEFHAQVLAPGALPLDLLESRIAAWAGR